MANLYPFVFAASLFSCSYSYASVLNEHLRCPVQANTTTNRLIVTQADECGYVHEGDVFTYKSTTPLPKGTNTFLVVPGGTLGENGITILWLDWKLQDSQITISTSRAPYEAVYSVKASYK